MPCNDYASLIYKVTRGRIARILLQTSRRNCYTWYDSKPFFLCYTAVTNNNLEWRQMVPHGLRYLGQKVLQQLSSYTLLCRSLSRPVGQAIGVCYPTSSHTVTALAQVHKTGFPNSTAMLFWSNNVMQHQICSSSRWSSFVHVVCPSIFRGQFNSSGATWVRHCTLRSVAQHKFQNTSLARSTGL